MKRDRTGRIIHRDDCLHAGSAIHWTWTDGMSDDELFVRMIAYPWLRLCKRCFGTTDSIALAMAAAGRGLSDDRG